MKLRFYPSLAFILLFLFAPAPAWACSCAVDAFQAPASKKNIERAYYIVEGRVTFVSPADAEKTKEFEHLTAFGITVSKTLKGDGMKMLTAYANTKSKCGVTVENLKRMDFFVLYEQEGQLMLAGACNKYISPEDRLALMRAALLKR